MGGHSHCETALKDVFHGKLQDPGIVGLSDLTKGPAIERSKRIIGFPTQTNVECIGQ
jgi:hypothetical protein